MTTNIYVLKLEGGRYYVGKSDNIAKRYQEHLNGGGSAWTRKYAPVSLEKTYEKASPFDEDKITKEYMLKYGVDKVRGASYVSVVLDDDQHRALERELFAVQDKCVNCGRSGHFVKDCYTKTDVSGNSLLEDSDDSDEEDSDEEDEFVWGCEYCDREFNTEHGCIVHERSCKNTYIAILTARGTKSMATGAKSTAKGAKSMAKGSKLTTKGVCYTCGRPGHYSPDCYARTHANGYAL